MRVYVRNWLILYIEYRNVKLSSCLGMLQAKRGVTDHTKYIFLISINCQVQQSVCCLSVHLSARLFVCLSICVNTQISTIIKIKHLKLGMKFTILFKKIKYFSNVESQAQSSYKPIIQSLNSSCTNYTKTKLTLLSISPTNYNPFRHLE